MFKHKIANRLSLYFAVALLVFATVIGGIFMALFRNQTVKLHRDQLQERAEHIASVLSGYMGTVRGMGRGMMGYNLYLQLVEDIAGTDAWVVDRELNQITVGMGCHGPVGGYAVTDLPEDAAQLIRAVFDGETVISEDFSGLLTEPALTVGTPVKNTGGYVVGAVLLHSPVYGVQEAVRQGARLLAVSLAAALVTALMLSFALSKSFTDPIVGKEAQDALRLENIRREFVANISHELQTPITVIRGSLEALSEQVVTQPDQVSEYYRQMLREAAFLQRLVGELLDLATLQNPDFVIEKENLSVCALIEDVLRSARPVANQKGIPLRFNSACTDYTLYGDYGRIRQMLMILIDNAIKFSPENSSVEITLLDNTLRVCDFGPGISAAELPFIFDRFHKSRSEQNKTGTGLGLAIAKQIAERHGIRLTAENRSGGKGSFDTEGSGSSGAVFIIEMPQNN